MWATTLNTRHPTRRNGAYVVGFPEIYVERRFELHDARASRLAAQRAFPGLGSPAPDERSQSEGFVVGKPPD